MFLQAWKRADLSAEQLADTKWELVLGPNIDSNELRTAIIRNQGELLGNPSPLLWFKRQTGYKILFKNDIRPQTTLTIDLYTIVSVAFTPLLFMYKILLEIGMDETWDLGLNYREDCEPAAGAKF